MLMFDKNHISVCHAMTQLLETARGFTNHDKLWLVGKRCFLDLLYLNECVIAGKRYFNLSVKSLTISENQIFFFLELLVPRYEV